MTPSFCWKHMQLIRGLFFFFFFATMHHLGTKGKEMFYSGSFTPKLLVATLRQSRKEISIDEKAEIVLDSSALNFILHDSSI